MKACAAAHFLARERTRDVDQGRTENQGQGDRIVRQAFGGRDDERCSRQARAPEIRCQGHDENGLEAAMSGLL